MNSKLHTVRLSSFPQVIQTSFFGSSKPVLHCPENMVLLNRSAIVSSSGLAVCRHSFYPLYNIAMLPSDPGYLRSVLLVQVKRLEVTGSAWMCAFTCSSLAPPILDEGV